MAAETPWRDVSVGAPPADPAVQGPDADPEKVARTILLDALSGRARSRSELAERLARRRVPPEVAEPLLERFTEVGLIDDAAFARLWIEQRTASRGLAGRALAHELRRKGVDDEIVREALDERDPEGERAVAVELVRRKARSLGRLDRPTQVRRLVGMLGRKGYSPGVAYGVVTEVLGELPEPPDVE
jgi:regulatory protein